MASSENAADTSSVLLWCLPHTGSTSFLKCMTYVPNSQVWYEPYMMSLQFSNSYNYREEIVGVLLDAWGGRGKGQTIATYGSRVSGGYWAADKSHSWVKSQLENPPPKEKKIAFVKEMSWGIDGFYEHIPDGFRHTFLIRHPYKIFQPWDRTINRGIVDESKRMKISEMPESLMSKGLFWKEQYDLYLHVKDHYEENPVIIDSDDLLADPGSILKAYCQAVGIPYTDDLLQWKPGRECLDREWMVAKEQILFHDLGNHHAETFDSTGFQKPTDLPTRKELSEDVRNCSDRCMKYYQEMYANRLQV